MLLESLSQAETEEEKNNSQFNNPTHIFVDQNYSIYVSDHTNHRVMKWLQNATEGIIVAGGNSDGVDLVHLNSPMGVFVDRSGHVYVADVGEVRIMRWLKGASKGSVILGGKGFGGQPNQFNVPYGLTFDGEGSIYVSDVKQLSSTKILHRSELKFFVSIVK
jgi:sugar lactone lactonase YvrE